VWYKITYILEEHTICNFGVEVNQVEKVVYYVECRRNLMVQRGLDYTIRTMNDGRR
jgi:hypothetical protein